MTMNEELSAIIKEKYLRVSREHPSAEIVDGKAPKPDLNQARTELAKVIGKFAEQFLAKKYSPLIGTVAESSAATYLQKFEENVAKAKGDVTLVVQELVDRIMTNGRLRK